MRTRIKYLLLFLLALTFALNANHASAQRYQGKDKSAISNHSDNTSDKDTATSRSDSSKKFHLPEKLAFGGSLGLYFGPVTYIDLSPLVGYNVKRGLQIGAGPSYVYMGFKYYDQNGVLIGKESMDLYGGRMYAQYVLPFLNNIFLHGEYELMNVPDRRYHTYPYVRTWIGSPLIGGGFQSQLGPRAYYSLMVLINPNFARNNEVSPYYNSPIIIRGGIML